MLLNVPNFIVLIYVSKQHVMILKGQETRQETMSKTYLQLYCSHNLQQQFNKYILKKLIYMKCLLLNAYPLSFCLLKSQYIIDMMAHAKCLSPYNKALEY